MKTIQIIATISLSIFFLACSDEKILSNKTEETKKVVAPNEIGARVYKMCAECHGTDGRNIALGRSRSIAGWEPQRVKDGLKSFVDGTYKGPMAGIMKTKIEALSQEEIDQVSIYIHNL